MRPWRMQPTAGNPSSLLRSWPDTVNARALSAGGAAEDMTIPTGAVAVLFSANGDFYAKANGTATVPGDTTDGSAAELNPTMWAVDAELTEISLISPASGATIVTATFYGKA